MRYWSIAFVLICGVAGFAGLSGAGGISGQAAWGVFLVSAVLAGLSLSLNRGAALSLRSVSGNAPRNF